MQVEISPRDLAAMMNDPAASPFLLLDVREQWEWQLTHIEGSVHIPMNLIPIRLNELPDDKLIVTVCHHGVRSLNVTHYLREAGFEQVCSLKSGIDGWSGEVDPSLPRY